MSIQVVNQITFDHEKNWAAMRGSSRWKSLT